MCSLGIKYCLLRPGIPLYLLGLCPLRFNLFLSLTLALFRTHIHSHIAPYVPAPRLAAPRRAAGKHSRCSMIDRPTDVPARRRETPGRDDSIKRFDCSSRDDCPLIENVLDPVERARREKTSSRVVPIWRWCLSNLSATVSNHA